MRRLVTTAVAGLFAAAAAGQDHGLPPGVSIGKPAPITTPLLPTLPPPAPAAPVAPPLPPVVAPPLPPVVPPPPPAVIVTPVAPAVPAPPAGFAIGPPPGTVLSPVMVRPPMPVAGAPEEIPPGPRFWGSFEYLLWRSKGASVPPLVVAVAGSTPTIHQAVVVSDNTINGGLQSGFRLTGGMWLDKPRGTGVVASYLSFLESGDVTTYLSGPGVVLARPFIDANRGVPALFQLSTPAGTTDGAATVRTNFDAESFEVNMLRRGPAMIGEEMHWVMGVRYINLEESLAIEAISDTGGLRAGSFDRFSTRNNFYGAQVGGRWNFTRNNFTVDVTLKLGLGGMGQEAVVAGGSTVVMASGTRIERPGGLLALGSNIGDYDRTKIVLLRDFSISVGYCLMENVTLRLGYDMLWLSNVLRPGEQIDQRVNPTLLPFSARPPAGVLRPEYRHNGESFYLHGISLGLAVQF